ncbi:MAG: cobalt-precorrin 5A hydrolase / precorrin-3B C17-methyltransferase, partial [Rhodobacteraceae bacterium]
ASEYEIQVIPGVTSVSASAAVAGAGLVRGDQTFQVLPATLSDGALAARLADGNGAFAILKMGRHAGRIKTLLARLGRLDNAMLVEKATWADQRVMPFRDFEGEAAYFAQVLLPARAQEATLVLNGVAVLCLNTAALATAKMIRAALPNATLYGLKGRVDEKAVDRLFDNVTDTLRHLFEAGTPIAAIMASGIVIRALAPLLGEKRAEPPVVALSPDGAHIVPLLGGHGGANRLAQSLSQITGGFAAITTAGDNALGLALDEPPAEWSVSNAQNAKAIVAKRLSGENVGLSVESGDASWLTGFSAGDDVVVTHRRIDVPGKTLVLHPPTLALGVGC